MSITIAAEKSNQAVSAALIATDKPPKTSLQIYFTLGLFQLHDSNVTIMLRNAGFLLDLDL